MPNILPLHLDFLVVLVLVSYTSCQAEEIAELDSCRDAQTQLHQYMITNPEEIYGALNACFSSTQPPGSLPDQHGKTNEMRCRSHTPHRLDSIAEART